MAAFSHRPNAEGTLMGNLHSRCEHHPSEEMVFYCRSCGEAACRDCIAFDRKHSRPPCDYKPIEDAAKTCREDLRSLTRRLDDKKAEASEGAEKLEANMKQVRAKYEEEISGFYDRLARALEKKKEKTIHQLHEGSQSLAGEICAWRKETRDLLAQIQQVEDSIDGLSDKDLLAQSDALALQVADVALKAIPVATTRAVAPETVSVEAIMAKLGRDLPAYSEVDPNQSTVQVEKEVRVDTTARVYMTLCDSAGFPCSVSQKVSVEVVPLSAGAGGPVLTASVTPLSSSRYLASFTPILHHRGPRKLIVEVNRQRIDKDSISVLVECPPQNLQQQTRTVDDIMHRGCLKVIGDRVFCHTMSQSREPMAVYIDGYTVKTAYKLKLPLQCPLRQWAPDEIAIGNNSLYISDLLNHKIHCFKLEDGSYVASTGSRGSERGQFNRPNGLCVAQDGLLYVCDSENHRIQVLNETFRVCSAFGEMGTGRCCFLWPSNIASSCEDETVRLYVSELHNHRIQCLTSAGDHIRFLGSQGSGDCQLSRPNILHIHRSHLFVSDDRGVVVFTLSGEFITRFATELCKVDKYPIEGLTVSSDGLVYVYHCPQNRIFLY